MKNLFASYYELSESRIKEIWSNSLIVFDANVLLNLYRYNKSTRDDFFRLMKSYKNRLWIPYQVALEFHRNREKVVKDTYDAYQKITYNYHEDKNTFRNQLKMLRKNLTNKSEHYQLFKIVDLKFMNRYLQKEI